MAFPHNQPQPLFAIGPPPAPPPTVDEPPARVIVGVNVLHHLTKKTEQEIVCNDTQIERFDGQKLTVEEENLQATTVNMLCQYIAGTLKPTKAELAVQGGKGKSGKLIGCVACGTQRKVEGRTCPLCEGTGFILVTPVYHNPN